LVRCCQIIVSWLLLILLLLLIVGLVGLIRIAWLLCLIRLLLLLISVIIALRRVSISLIITTCTCRFVFSIIRVKVLPLITYHGGSTRIIKSSILRYKGLILCLIETLTSLICRRIEAGCLLYRLKRFSVLLRDES
jgi:hypothetical protein